MFKSLGRLRAEFKGRWVTILAPDHGIEVSRWPFWREGDEYWTQIHGQDVRGPDFAGAVAVLRARLKGEACVSGGRMGVALRDGDLPAVVEHAQQQYVFGTAVSRREARRSLRDNFKRHHYAQHGVARLDETTEDGWLVIARGGGRDLITPADDMWDPYNWRTPWTLSSPQDSSTPTSKR